MHKHDFNTILAIKTKPVSQLPDVPYVLSIAYDAISNKDIKIYSKHEMCAKSSSSLKAQTLHWDLDKKSQ